MKSTVTRYCDSYANEFKEHMLNMSRSVNFLKKIEICTAKGIPECTCLKRSKLLGEQIADKVNHGDIGFPVYDDHNSSSQTC